MRRDLPGSGDRTTAALGADSLGLHLRIPLFGLHGSDSTFGLHGSDFVFGFNLRIPWFGWHGSESIFGFHLRIPKVLLTFGQKWFGRS